MSEWSIDQSGGNVDVVVGRWEEGTAYWSIMVRRWRGKDRKLEYSGWEMEREEGTHCILD